ncbi:MAG: hypothetical protein IJU98_00450 [Synergistaceae bacterium]|nr:hypothetical protein [Synergistaceae bacterium]
MAEGNEAQSGSQARNIMEEWQERKYMAFVNFLRKKNLFEDWKGFKARAGKSQPDLDKLMTTFLSRVG